MKNATLLKGSIVQPFIICILVAITLPGCDTKKPIKIGFIAGTSGRVADLGLAGLEATQMIVEKTNKQGGINGRRIQLVVRDDRHDPDAARRAVQDLIKEEVAAVIGPMTSQMGVAIAPILNKAKLLNVSPTITTQHLSGVDDYFFRVSPSVRVNATLNANYQIKSGDMTRIAAVYDAGNRAFTENWLENFKETFVAGGGKIATSISFISNKKRPFWEIANRILVLDIDGILIIANSMDSALLCQQIRKINIEIKITLAEWGAIEQLMELGGKAVEGVTVVQAFDRNSPHPKYQAFRKTYMERYGREPGFPGVHTYNAAHVILTALKAQKASQDLKETVLSIREFEGVQGKFKFDDFGDVQRSNASMRIVKDGKFVALE